MRIKNIMLLSLIVLFASIYAGETKKGAQISRKTLIFFQNPYGGPCQYQLEILNGVSDSLKKYCSVEHVRTDVSSDREKFGAWGIRGLPQLIIVDSNKKELFRFSAGVQDGKTVLEKLRSVK